jgi:hypothetical protein
MKPVREKVSLLYAYAGIKCHDCGTTVRFWFDIKDRIEVANASWVLMARIKDEVRKS